MVKKIVILNILFLLLYVLHINDRTRALSTHEYEYKQKSNDAIINQIKKHIKQNDAILVLDDKSNEIVSFNPEKMMIPASILKIMTSLVALKYLGNDYRFLTEFYMDPESNLTIKGYGDPLLISEVVKEISTRLKSKINSKYINHIFLDNSYFKEPIVIPGVTENSAKPYNAPVGALCVNFNTVFFSQEKNSTYISAEKQTPLLPYVLDIIKKSGLKKGRIILSQKQNLFYAGHLFAYYLKKEGINIKGEIKKKILKKNSSKIIYSYASNYSLKEIIKKLLLYSNNFIANQLYITCGAKILGYPGSLEKGTHVASQYIKNELPLKNIFFVEGSGISRNNRVTAKIMMCLLKKFKSHHSLLRLENNEYFKTGTLNNILTRVGYLKKTSGELYPFVIILNTKNRPLYLDMHNIRKYIKKLK